MFQGAMVAIVTPFKNGLVDETALRELIEFQIANGTHGIVPCGTTGESATLSFQEHERVIEITVEQVNKRVPVIAGTGSNNTEEAIRLTKHAKKAGADGALMICPYYNKPTQEGLFRHFEKVASSVDIPIVLYNIPGRTAVNMAPETLARLSKIDNIVAVKEASGTMKQITDIIALCGDGLVVLSGEDYLTFPLLCVGGKGVISVSSNIVPRDMADLCNLFFDGKINEARELYYRLLPLCHGLFYETNPAPVKAALAMMKKIDSEEVRLPLVPMQESNRERLKKDLLAYGLI
ncbi:4-hydroxy-tetrahydrodipicolinate synthase [Desulforhabdus amnigena]|jgi:4-hydroxy-tetrahydrodipicolinate synthase|uniref:4-hydroxy-tetrahydrodipicolinate synthase n=1 Tax=Desulforhabdus amnigena TaxID=40218 RepID=A0A9W6CVU9_9BACT|nr:4-hydroxy-tetrahydrodipicolinate synthase [Desulforhabdus amnigena]NLJ29783.1 4-hydroxy-tetrahydrodipicolinate synthase [Deltaproteobacteria bacterium]GLI33494.1 4-hydroxy-tetrahydrodipicolinate synthase [Desulforhabdus amnigena]